MQKEACALCGWLQQLCISENKIAAIQGSGPLCLLVVVGPTFIDFGCTVKYVIPRWNHQQNKTTELTGGVVLLSNMEVPHKICCFICHLFIPMQYLTCDYVGFESLEEVSLSRNSLQSLAGIESFSGLLQLRLDGNRLHR